jgi:hypothetical protein
MYPSRENVPADMRQQPILVFPSAPLSRIKREEGLNSWVDDSPVEYTGFLEDVAEIDVSIKEVRIEGDRLLEVVNGQPYFALGIEDAA